VTAVWWTIGVLALGTFMIKAAGPLTVGDTQPPDWLRRVTVLLAPALLAALVVHETFTGPHGELRIDARAAGLLAAAVALVCRLPLTVVIILAAATAALVRLLQ
jgi:branched-subunit amino acid transport protein